MGTVAWVVTEFTQGRAKEMEGATGRTAKERL